MLFDQDRFHLCRQQEEIGSISDFHMLCSGFISEGWCQGHRLFPLACSDLSDYNWHDKRHGPFLQYQWQKVILLLL